jgi:hypothetical protein
MSPRRKQLVGMAFSKMDKNGSGFLDPEDVIDTYDASKHPDVLAGKKTADEVLREFLDTFDVGGEKDGKVTRNEFENYYTNIGANIDNDDYFELMIRNAWHISGGEGWSANSSNRRVLVTHADGRETVEEIKDDMGLKAGDKSGMIARLRAQGVQSSAVNIFGGYEDVTKPSHVPSSFKELVEQGRAGRSTSQVSQNQSHGKKRSTNTKIFQSSVVIGDDGGSSSSHPTKQNLKVKKILIFLDFLLLTFRRAAFRGCMWSRI